MVKLPSMMAKYLVHYRFLNMNLKKIKNKVKDQMTFSSSSTSDIPMPKIKELIISVTRQTIEMVKKLMSRRS